MGRPFKKAFFCCSEEKALSCSPRSLPSTSAACTPQLCEARGLLSMASRASPTLRVTWPLLLLGLLAQASGAASGMVVSAAAGLSPHPFAKQQRQQLQQQQQQQVVVGSPLVQQTSVEAAAALQRVFVPSLNARFLRRARQQRELLFVVSLAASLAVAFLLLQCAGFLRSSKAAAAAAAAGGRGRRLAGGGDPLDNCERGQAGGDSGEGGGDRRPQGRSRLSTIAAALSRLFRRRRERPRQEGEGQDNNELTEVVVVPDSGPPLAGAAGGAAAGGAAAPAAAGGAGGGQLQRIPGLSNVLQRLGQENMALAVVATGVILNMHNPAAQALVGLVVAGLLLLGAEESFFTSAEGRQGALARLLAPLAAILPRPTGNAAVIFRCGIFYTLAGMQVLMTALDQYLSMRETGGSAAAVNATTTPATPATPATPGSGGGAETEAALVLQFLGGALELLSGIDQVIYGLTNGRVSLSGFLFRRRGLPAQGEQQQEQQQQEQQQQEGEEGDAAAAGGAAVEADAAAAGQAEGGGPGDQRSTQADHEREPTEKEMDSSDATLDFLGFSGLKRGARCLFL
ncbi:hypothetical protein Efla_001574 [Eimeria flavescens]